MKNLYTAQFGAFPVRFVYRDGDVFVSRDDLISALRDCFIPRMRGHVEAFVNSGLDLLGDADDRRAAPLDENVVGPVIHFHAVGNLLHSLGDMTDVDNDDLRESSYRISALLRWYSQTLSQVNDYFQRDIAAMLHAVTNRLDRLIPLFVVDVTHDMECGMWVAECEAIGLATEAETYDALTDRVWEIAPEIAADNGIGTEGMRIRFQQVQSVGERVAL